MRGCATSWCDTNRRPPTRRTGTHVPAGGQHQNTAHARGRGAGAPPRNKKAQPPGAPPATGRGGTPPRGGGVRGAARLIAAAERPLLMVGHGVIIGNAYTEVRALAE